MRVILWHSIIVDANDGQEEEPINEESEDDRFHLTRLFISDRKRRDYSSGQRKRRDYSSGHENEEIIHQNRKTNEAKPLMSRLMKSSRWLIS
jgi:hypothetical protein